MQQTEAEKDFDVVIAGAGPVGLTLAIDLGQRGVRTLVLEREATTGPWPKMDRSNARTMELYRRLGFVDRVRSVGYPADASMDVFIVRSLSDEPLLKLHYPSVSEFRRTISECTDHSQPLEPYQLVSQNKLEPVLKAVAETTPNVTVRFGCGLVDFVDDSDGVVRRQNIWLKSRRKLAECGPRPGVDIKRRSCGAASADVRWSSV